MLSPEFSSAVKSGNLLRARIMLKDSMIVDPTFFQFNEMLAYAKRELPDLLEPYDNEILENDKSKWTTDTMNTELVEIVNNFSDVRINHLREVIGVVLADNIKKASYASPHTVSRDQKPMQGAFPTHGNPSPGTYRSSSISDVDEQKKIIRKQALSQITNSSKKIAIVMDNVQVQKKWTLADIQELEKAASQILSAARNYKNNR